MWAALPLEIGHSVTISYNDAHSKTRMTRKYCFAAIRNASNACLNMKMNRLMTRIDDLHSLPLYVFYRNQSHSHQLIILQILPCKYPEGDPWSVKHVLQLFNIKIS